MKLKNISAFLAVIEQGNFSSAAKSLYISQPTLSSRIQQLEEDLNVTLFHRGRGSKTILTSEGEKIYPLLEKGLDYLQKAEQVAQQSRPQFNKHITLSTPNHMGTNIVPELLRAINKEYSLIDFSLNIGTTITVLKDMEEGKSNMGLVYLEANSDSKYFKMYPVARENILLVCAPNYPLIKKAPLSPIDIKNERILVYKKTFISTITIDKYLIEHGLSDMKKTEIKNLEWLKRMVEKGLGITFLQKTFIQQELDDKTLVELPFSIPLPSTPISILFSHELPQHFINFVNNTIKNIFLSSN